jgi:hypothetical protein
LKLYTFIATRAIRNMPSNVNREFNYITALRATDSSVIRHAPRPYASPALV